MQLAGIGMMRMNAGEGPVIGTKRRSPKGRRKYSGIRTGDPLG